jgi:hypothetical protein
MPQYQSEQREGEFFGKACSGVGWQLVGEYLYIRPSNAEVAFAQVVSDGTGTRPIDLPIGRTGVSNPYFDAGFRLSAARALGDCAAIGVSYTYFNTSISTTLLATETLETPPPADAQVRSLIFHPSAPDAVLGDSAEASQSIRVQLGDVDYKAALVSGPRYCANALVGVRFASLDQHFNSSVTTGAGISELMYTNVRFEGAGLRLGLEGERQSPSNGFLVYGKGAASFVAGTFRADYSEFNVDNPHLIDTNWKANRVITMLDFELGAGWASEDGTIRVTGGWMVSGWYNTVKPSNYIRAVQNNNNNLAVLDSPMENVLAFDGLVFRVEWRF